MPNYEYSCDKKRGNDSGVCHEKGLLEAEPPPQRLWMRKGQGKWYHVMDLESASAQEQRSLWAYANPGWQFELTSGGDGHPGAA